MAAGVVAGCGGEPDATDFTIANRRAFLAACTGAGTGPPSDDRLVRDICECTYDEIEANLDYDDLVGIEDSLVIDGLAPLPDSIAGFMADCFVAEADI